MISQLIKQELLTQRANKIQAVTGYKKFLLDNRLSISKAFNYSALVEELKMNEFQSLLRVDKSIALRFDRLRDESEKAKFIDDKVNLTGWIELDTIKQFQKVIGDSITVSDNGVYQSDLLAYNLDALAAIEAQIIDWSGHKVYDEFKEAAKALNKFYQFYNSYFSDSTFDEPFDFFHHLFHSPVRFDFNDKGELEVNELMLANHYFGEINRAKWEIKQNEIMKKMKKEEAEKQKNMYKR